MQRLARNALSAARLTNWSFGSSPLNPGGLPVWTSAADNMRRSQRWQHTWLSPLSTRTAAHGSAKIVEQQLTAKRWPGRWQSAAASDLLWSQQQWLQQGMATSAAANAAELPAATQPPAAAAPSAPKPWTPTDQLQKRKILPKRMGHLLAVIHLSSVCITSLAPLHKCCWAISQHHRVRLMMTRVASRSSRGSRSSRRWQLNRCRTLVLVTTCSSSWCVAAATALRSRLLHSVNTIRHACQLVAYDVQPI